MTRFRDTVQTGLVTGVPSTDSTMNANYTRRVVFNSTNGFTQNITLPAGLRDISGKVYMLTAGSAATGGGQVRLGIAGDTDRFYTINIAGSAANTVTSTLVFASAGALRCASGIDVDTAVVASLSATDQTIVSHLIINGTREIV